MTFFAILTLLLGVACGSFLNAYVWRFLRVERITDRHSVCVHCGHALRWYDLLPIVSFLILGGRCRDCRRPIPWHYPLVELGTGLAFFAVFLRFGIGWETAVALALTFFLAALFLLDVRYSLLPDAMTLPGIAVAALLGVVFDRGFGSMLIGGIVGAGFFAAQHYLSRGQWVGSGDIRLGALLGIALGWQLALLAMFLAYVSGALVGIVLIATGKKGWHSHVPFGAFLTTATFVTLLWGNTLLHVVSQLSLLPRLV